MSGFGLISGWVGAALSRGVFVLLLALPLLWLPGAQSARAQVLKIAIVELDAVNQPAKAGGWGRIAAEVLTTAAVKSGAFEVVERHLLEKVMSEQSMGAREVGFASVAESIGNMVGADYLLSGSVMKIDEQVQVEARLLDVGTGAILTAQRMTAPAALDKFSKKSDELMAALVKSVYGGAPAPATAPAAPGGKAPVVGRPLEVSVQLAAAAGLNIPLRQEDSLTAQDAYFLELRTARALHVYAVQVDAMGNLYALFPNPDFARQGNPLPPGQSVRVPEAENFHLDATTGKETILVLAAAAPVPEAERILGGLATADPFAMEDLARQFQDLLKAAEPDLTYSVWFWHR